MKLDFITLKQNFKNWLWKDLKNCSIHDKILRSFVQIASAVIMDLKKGQLSLRAMSLVYTTLISLVPLFAISFSVLKGLGAHNQIRPFLYNALEGLGDKKVEVVDKIISFVDNIQVGILGALGIAILIYTVMAMLQKIENSFNYVWRVGKSRSFSKKLSDYLSVLFVGPLLIFLSAAMTTTVRTDYFNETLQFIPAYDLIVALVGFVIPYIIMTFAFAFIYSFIPNTKVKVKSAFVGGLATAISWKLMGWGFANFVANSSNQTAVYSAFATVIIFMVWLYMVWLVLLIGASISFYFQHPNYRLTRYKTTDLSCEHKEALAVAIMKEVANSFEDDNDSSKVNYDSLVAKLNHKKLTIEKICNHLKKAKLIVFEEKTQNIIPAKPLEKISILQIINSVRKYGNNQKQTNADIQNYINEIDEKLKQSFDNIYLR